MCMLSLQGMGALEQMLKAPLESKDPQVAAAAAAERAMTPVKVLLASVNDDSDTVFLLMGPEQQRTEGGGNASLNA